MRHYKIMALCLSMLVIPTVATAQTNVKKAFDKFLNSSKVVYTERHSLDKDPETNEKTGQYDIYEYTISAKDKSLITDLQRAFDKDKEQAYTIESGVSRYKNSWAVSVAVGDGTSTNVGLGNRKGENFTYSCFIDEADASRTHRYAYGISWLEDGKEITGRLIITYATTLKYRQSKKNTSVMTNRNDVITMSLNDYQEAQLGNFYFYAKRLEEFMKTDGAQSSFMANELYKICKNSKQADSTDKNLMTNELVRLKGLAKDEFLRQLLQASIDYLK